MQDSSSEPLRLAELLVPLSLVTDLGMGAPDEAAARACLVATGLARWLALPETVVADVYYTTLLKHLGCTATAHEEAERLGGDELATRPLFSRTDERRPSEMLSLLASIGADRPPRERARIIVGTIGAGSWGGEVQRAVCEVASLAAGRLGMSSAVQGAIGQTFERWDGKGPLGRTGNDIPLAARLAAVASRAVAVSAVGGVDAAVRGVRQSAGGWFDPEIAAGFAQCGGALLADLEARDPLEAAIAGEPRPWRRVTPSEIGEIARAFADIGDLKSSFTLGHSTGVERLASKAGGVLGLDEGDARDLQLAALLHDLGRVGIPSGTWEKATPLGAAEQERIRLHAYYSERILARCEPLVSVAAIAGRHHERLDGSGYHRGAASRELSMSARLLAAADAYQTKTEPRPHREALRAEQAADHLAAEAKAGRLDHEAVRAVLDAAGAPSANVPRTAPAGLTARELDVLRLMADGCANREVAERLVISPRTAEHHVQHIYEKIGVSTRAGAVIFALEHDLLTPRAS